MKSKLKRCPWCNTHELKMECNDAVYWIECRCDAAGPSALTKERAVELWNRGSNPDCLLNFRKSNQHEMKEVEIDFVTNPKTDVYTRQECPFKYCDDPKTCKNIGRCRHS